MAVSVTGTSFLTMPNDINEDRFFAHLLLSITHLDEIFLRRIAPDAIASIIPL